MERLFILFIVFAILLMPACSKQTNADGQQKGSSSWDPLDVFMSNHIRITHNFSLGSEAFNDLIIEYDGGPVKVQFSDTLVMQTKGQINKIFKFTDTGQEMSKEKYLIFLTKLHAYLTINPISRN